MADVVIIDAVRTAIGRRNGTLAKSHANDVLGAVQKSLIARSGLTFRTSRDPNTPPLQEVLVEL